MRLLAHMSNCFGAERLWKYAKSRKESLVLDRELSIQPIKARPERLMPWILGDETRRRCRHFAVFDLISDPRQAHMASPRSSVFDRKRHALSCDDNPFEVRRRVWHPTLTFPQP